MICHWTILKCLGIENHNFKHILFSCNFWNAICNISRLWIVFEVKNDLTGKLVNSPFVCLSLYASLFSCLIVWFHVYLSFYLFLCVYVCMNAYSSTWMSALHTWMHVCLWHVTIHTCTYVCPCARKVKAILKLSVEIMRMGILY